MIVHVMSCWIKNEYRIVAIFQEATKCLRTQTTDLSEMRAMMTRLEKDGKLDMLFVMMNTFLRRGGIEVSYFTDKFTYHSAGEISRSGRLHYFRCN